ncbi:hypothetical protein NBRC110019_28120 [Neptunitalea chrysea]|uniref:Uncharacterized protein n=1 Tax=Neptunitalea chrysea TaxID=1647581 RepID=A0A9W6B756_9FLAO|nr:hypothetical protein NBRC110019_28120 [Neptunitalea chrysea]
MLIEVLKVSLASHYTLETLFNKLKVFFEIIEQNIQSHTAYIDNARFYLQNFPFLYK